MGRPSSNGDMILPTTLEPPARNSSSGGAGGGRHHSSSHFGYDEMGGGDFRPQYRHSSSSGRNGSGGGGGGWMPSMPSSGLVTHIIIMGMPVLGSCFVLSTLYLLATRNNAKNFTISETSISLAMTMYEPYMEVLMLLTFAAITVFIATISRNIQIGIYIQRHLQAQQTWMSRINIVSTWLNILAYIGLVMIALFPINDQDQQIQQLHSVGSAMFFAGSAAYNILHAYPLLYSQDQYSKMWKLIFGGLAAVSTLCICLYSYDRTKVQFEWYAVVLNAIYVGLLAALFHIDPVDDEIRDYFQRCCFCNRS